MKMKIMQTIEINESHSEQYERRRIVRNCIQLEGLYFQFNFEIMKYLLKKANQLLDFNTRPLIRKLVYSMNLGIITSNFSVIIAAFYFYVLL